MFWPLFCHWRCLRLRHRRHPGRESQFQPIPGAHLARVINGDTIAVSARIWVSYAVESLVHIASVDTPELVGHCVEEPRLAIRAKNIAERLHGQNAIIVHEIQYGKFAGPFISRVLTQHGRDLTDALITEGPAGVM